MTLQEPLLLQAGKCCVGNQETQGFISVCSARVALIGWLTHAAHLQSFISPDLLIFIRSKK